MTPTINTQLNAAHREGRLRAFIQEHQTPETVDALRDLYEKHPKDHAISQAWGALAILVRDRRVHEIREKQIPLERKAVLAARAEYLSRPDLNNDQFWGFVIDTFPEGCEACESRLSGYAQRVGEMILRCGNKGCRHEVEMLPKWREREATANV